MQSAKSVGNGAPPSQGHGSQISFRRPDFSRFERPAIYESHENDSRFPSVRQRTLSSPASFSRLKLDGQHHDERQIPLFQAEQVTNFEAPLLDNIWIWLQAVLTCAAVAFTIYFAYNCSLEIPQSQTLIFSQPGNTILTLNILSQITILFLAQLTNSVFESVRWAFVCSQGGMPALSFLALGSSTPYYGVLKALLSGLKAFISNPRRYSVMSRDSPGVWGTQRFNLHSAS
jgi:hypothetical protein